MLEYGRELIFVQETSKRKVLNWRELDDGSIETLLQSFSGLSIVVLIISLVFVVGHWPSSKEEEKEAHFPLFKMASNNKNIPVVLDFEDDDSGVGGTSGGSCSTVDAGVVDDSSFYGILNVPVDASDDDLKRSFRLLAAACHPDKVRDPELRPAAAEAFAKVQAAYEVS